MIALFATMVARSGRRDELMAELEKLSSAVALEQGTLVYAMHMSDREPDVVRFYENYVDKEALRAHGSSQAMSQFIASTTDLLAQPVEIVRCDIVSAKGLPAV
jgi:quinol monooxygenase YgiN